MIKAVLQLSYPWSSSRYFNDRETVIEATAVPLVAVTVTT
jgi:hypothetical protein